MAQYKYEVTIGIPVYCVEKYIRNSLESALNQSFDNIEIIVIDDKGADKSIDIVKELQQSHPRGKNIHIITQQKNLGVSAARNRIIKEAQGKYIYFMDSDDYISEDCIEVLYNAAEKYCAEAVYGSSKSIENGITHVFFSYKYTVFDKEDEFASYANKEYKTTVTYYIWNVLFYSDFIRNTKLQFPNIRFWEDVLFNSRLQPLITRAVLLPNITYYYIMHQNSLSHYENRDIINNEEICQHLINAIDFKNQCKELRDKPYFEMRCAKVMLQVFYTVIGILKNKKKINSTISDNELRNTMSHPIPFKEIIHFKKHKLDNLLFYSIGKIPTPVSIFVMKILAKYKGIL